MQKAQRLACSTASMSSPSNTSLTLRRRSRTSSAGGDYVEASKSNISKNQFESKFRLRKRNNKARLEKKGSKKKTKKTAKINKSVRPTFGSLQNTVVLAPFHTLKKCFQTKLVDQYLNEKIKKHNHKTKMAEKQNMLFEYDVMELKPLEQKNAKKEKSGSKGKKGRVRFKEAKSNRKRSKSEKSQSYCQCEKNNQSKGKEQKINLPKNSSSRNHSSKAEKRSFQASLAPNNYQRVFSIPGSDEIKRRKFDSPQTTNLTRGPQFDIIPDLLELNRPSCSEPTSETNASFSNVSSGPKIDSWETISDSPSYIVLEGSLAISTTSFDSSLEKYEKDSCNYSEESESISKSSGTNSGYSTRLKTLKEKPERSNNAADFIANMGDDESRQYIMNDGNSDRQLMDFMESELQAQVLSSSEVPQHVQPLRRKIKTQARKSDRENDSSKAYFLRSQSASKECVGSEEHTFLGKYRKNDELERSDPSGTASGAHEEGGNVEREENYVEPIKDSCEGNFAIENLLIKTNTSCQADQNPADLSQTPPELSSSNIENNTDISKVSETTDEVNRCSNQKETNLNLNVGNEPPCEVLYKWGSDTKSDEQKDSITNKSPEIDKTDFGSEERTAEGQRLIGDFGDQSFLELFPAPPTTDRFQESLDADRHVAHHPQDKEPSFIFGPRTTSERLGESCEFSLGLNWVFSDDDNSEHGDHFL